MENNQKEEMQSAPQTAEVIDRPPKKRMSFKKFFWLTLLLLIVAYIAYSNWGGKINRWYRWSEEVQLSSGEIIWVNRATRYYTWSDWLTQGGGVKNRVSTVTFDNEKSKLGLPKWQAEGGGPIILDFDRDKQRWFIVETFFWCHEWKTWGNPNPPYRLYELVDGEWQLVPVFDMKLVGHRGNLVVSKPELASFIFRRSVTIEERKKDDANAGERFKVIMDNFDRCASWRKRS